MNILLTGANGKLGSQLHTQLASHHTVIPIGNHASNTFIDITDFHALNTHISAIQPHLVIHTATWTDVEGCAKEPHKATLINGLGTQNIATISGRLRIPLVYISTNEVFDGTHDRPYGEYDPTNPINPYGYSKWVGERATLTLNPLHYIIRTAWLFAHGGKNFIHAILNAVQANKPLRVVADEIANPTYNNDLALAITQLITTQRFGIYHFVNEGATSRYDFARYILDQSGYADVPIAKISSHEWQRASTPPRYASLHNMGGASVGITLRPWQQAVDAFLQKEGLAR
jgi:dTDP-4-dehydrorhamnose reductase